MRQWCGDGILVMGKPKHSIASAINHMHWYRHAYFGRLQEPTDRQISQGRVSLLTPLEWLLHIDFISVYLHLICVILPVH
jgi:hypothetical protein